MMDMGLQQFHMIRTQPVQVFLELRDQILRAVICGDPILPVEPYPTHFGGNLELISAALHGPAEQFLTVAHSVHIGSIEKSDPGFQGSIDSVERVLIINWPPLVAANCP